MKKSFIILSVGMLFLGLGSCSSDPKTEETKAEETKTNCMYSYDSSNSSLVWTAFKFTEKKGVEGTFNVISVESEGAQMDAKKLLESISFNIETSSVETQNEERNGKIAKLFFGTIGTETIKGNIKSLSDNGKATIEIEMNNIKKDVVGEYTLEDANFSFTATIDVLDWKAGSAISALNTACKDLHTGADGKSKLWSEVDLSFTTNLKKECK
ncbi:MAG: hypothetical protein RI922_1506 [Bacteroidota bacterium]|jgi:polyisoprenoid-binding protein YceI